MIRITTAAVLALAGTALAQYEITIDVENPVLLPGESTVVTMYAGFERRWFAMAGVDTDLVTSVGSVGWSDEEVLHPMRGPGLSPGTPSATGFDSILAGQLQFAGAMIAADPVNPAPFWRATYTAPIGTASPFEIELFTATNRYDVYVEIYQSFTVSGLADLAEGSATIRVIPAPASASLLALGLFAMRRRR